MGWTPAAGARTLVDRVGESESIEILRRLLEGSVPPTSLVVPPYRNVLLDIGDGHAERLMTDETGERLAYWPRVWAARALAYVGAGDVRATLLGAFDDGHWRVRMTAVQTVGRLGIDGATAPLLRRLRDEHSRVRAATVLALERVGTEDAIEHLLEPATQLPRTSAEQAVAAILHRASRPG